TASAASRKIYSPSRLGFVRATQSKSRASSSNQEIRSSRPELTDCRGKQKSAYSASDWGNHRRLQEIESMKAAIGRFAVRHAISIVFLVLALCFGGGYAARKMGSSVFPETDFPRVVIMADNGVMPADEMMATVTGPIGEAMNDVLACQTIRSTTVRGT